MTGKIPGLEVTAEMDKSKPCACSCLVHNNTVT